MTDGDALLRRLPSTTLIVGKGGVGKTTAAAALALRSSQLLGETRVITTDPARALPAVLDQPLGPTPERVSYAPRLTAHALDAAALRARFIDRWGDVLRTILDRGTYLDASDIGPLVDTAFPGGDEIFAALELATLLTEHNTPGSARLLVDTAPTGHTLRLLNLPAAFRAIVELLDSMQAKHRFMVRALTRTYKADAADAFLAEMTRLVTTFDESLRDSRRCAAIVVANEQPLVVQETRRYLQALAELQVNVTAIIWNAVDGVLPELDSSIEQFTVPRLIEWPIGRTGLEGWFAAVGRRDGKRTVQSAETLPRVPAREKTRARAGADGRDRLLRSLTIVAGKGGVGKTSVAAALALHASDTHRTLVVSTDPAPSLGDALGLNIPDADTPVGGDQTRLFARQMNATDAFERLRIEYASRVDALMEGLAGRGVHVTHDGAIARELLRLAPPGVDEVYAMSLLSDVVFDGRYERVIVDPAPTGHLLRLLEMPQLALSWCHQLLRLMLKYKEITGLGDTARELLEFSKRLRELDALLTDASRCGVVVVSLDEPIVHGESERLVREVNARGVSITGVVVNRTTGAVALPVRGAPMQLVAPDTDPSPVGVDALREWSSRWSLTSDGDSRVD